MEKFIHRENLALFKKRLSEEHDAAAHKVRLKLLADEEARDAQLPPGLIIEPQSCDRSTCPDADKAK